MSADDSAGAPSRGLLSELSAITVSTYQVSRGFVPLGRLLASADDISQTELSVAIDRLFE